METTKIRKDFPILDQTVYNRSFVYLDNAATTQKPNEVTDAIHNFYNHSNSSVHRGIHTLSEKATTAYENSRKTVQEFINAESTKEIIFTRGSTESINLLSYSFGEKYVNPGDEIIITQMEHHSNIVPWQMLCERKNATLRYIPIDKNGVLQLEELKNLLSEKTKLVAITHVSNSLGTINPVKEITETAHAADVPVLIDGAQSIQHKHVDVQDIDCDFFVFSGHKIYGPTGIGVLYGKEEYLEDMPPFHGGGEMIETVTMEKTTYNELPLKFEAGTPNFVGAIGMGYGLDYVSRCGLEAIEKHEKNVLDYATEQISKIDGVTIYGNAPEKASVISFNLHGIHSLDAGTIIDKMGVAVRTGHHCTQPVMNFFGIEGTIRASLAMYNTREDCDRLIEAIVKAKQMFG